MVKDKNIKILVIDDDNMNTELFTEILKRFGFIVEKSNSGEEALRQLEKFFPDLILLDNLMPGISGYDFAKILKSNPEYKNIEIIMISALTEKKEKEKFEKIGVTQYINKPVMFNELLSLINNIFKIED